MASNLINDYWDNNNFDNNYEFQLDYLFNMLSLTEIYIKNGECKHYFNTKVRNSVRILFGMVICLEVFGLEDLK